MDETDTLTPEQAEQHLRARGVLILSDREAAELITPTTEEEQ